MFYYFQGNSAKFRNISAAATRLLLDKDFHIWQLGRPNGGDHQQLLRITLTYFCDLDTHLNIGLQSASAHTAVVCLPTTAAFLLL